MVVVTAHLTVMLPVRYMTALLVITGITSLTTGQNERSPAYDVHNETFSAD